MLRKKADDLAGEFPRLDKGGAYLSDCHGYFAASSKGDDVLVTTAYRGNKNRGDFVVFDA